MTTAGAGHVRVKICGVRSPEVAREAAQAGADFLGLNFAPVSRRRVSAQVAREAIESCRTGLRAPQMAGVFVNQEIDEVAEIARDLRLEWVQLSGDEDVDYCRRVAQESGARVMKAVRLEQAAERARLEAFQPVVDLFLADTASQGSYGGSGKTWDWDGAKGVFASFRTLLAGGLSPQNVEQAIVAVRPWGVDVASGVETGGETDAEKVRAFIERAKGAQYG